MASDSIAEYRAYLTGERHASPNTISSYLRDVAQFAEYLTEHENCEVHLATSQMIQEYMGWMQGQGKSAASTPAISVRLS